MAHYELNVGRVGRRADAPSGDNAKFRLAVMGDFSGRANRGEIATGDALAKRKPLAFDLDTMDRVIAKFRCGLRLAVGGADADVELEVGKLDDLHPDALYDSLELFSHLRSLRDRLRSSRTFDKAAGEVRSWQVDEPSSTTRRRGLGSKVRVDATLSDFKRLLGKRVDAQALPTIDALVRKVVAPYVVEAEDPEQSELVDAVDRALSAAMRGVLHDPDFQALESAWRSLEFVVRRVETDPSLQIVVYDISAEELAADLSAVDDLAESGLFRLLVENPAADASQGPLSAIVGLYQFEMTPPHAELLGRVARLASHACAPFIASVGGDCIDRRKEDVHPLVTEAWNQLRSMPESAFVALTVPRFLLRAPYGQRSVPIQSFEFEEFDQAGGVTGMLWGNGAVLAGVVLCEQFRRFGPKMALTDLLSLGEMPYFFFEDEDEEQVALPCTDRLLTERKAAHVASFGFLPVLALKGQTEVRLAGLSGLSGKKLAGRWLSAKELAALRSPSGAAPAGVPDEEDEPVAEEEAAVQEDTSEDTASDEAASDSDAEAAAEADETETTESESEAAPDEQEPEAATAEATSPEDEELQKLLAELEGLSSPEATDESGTDKALEQLMNDLK